MTADEFVADVVARLEQLDPEARYHAATQLIAQDTLAELARVRGRALLEWRDADWAYRGGQRDLARRLGVHGHTVSVILSAARKERG